MSEFFLILVAIIAASSILLRLIDHFCEMGKQRIRVSLVKAEMDFYLAKNPRIYTDENQEETPSS